MVHPPTNAVWLSTGGRRLFPDSAWLRLDEMRASVITLHPHLKAEKAMLEERARSIRREVELARAYRAANDAKACEHWRAYASLGGTTAFDPAKIPSLADAEAAADREMAALISDEAGLHAEADDYCLDLLVRRQWVMRGLARHVDGMPLAGVPWRLFAYLDHLDCSGDQIKAIPLGYHFGAVRVVPTEDVEWRDPPWRASLFMDVDALMPVMTAPPAGARRTRLAAAPEDVAGTTPSVVSRAGGSDTPSGPSPAAIALVMGVGDIRSGQGQVAAIARIWQRQRSPAARPESLEFIKGDRRFDELLDAFFGSNKWPSDTMIRRGIYIAFPHLAPRKPTEVAASLIALDAITTEAQ